MQDTGNQPPATRYAKSGDVSIAYGVVGDGPIDIVYVPGWVSHLEYAWEEPRLAHFYRRLASFARLILFDKRGTGLSDRVAELPDLERRMDDVRAVMDAAGSQRAAIIGQSEGGPMSILFAATYPDRTSALITMGTYARRVWAPDYPWAPTPEERQEFFDLIEREWGGEVDLATLAPSAAHDPSLRRWFSTYFRLSASPGAALALARMNTQIDVRNVLPAIHVPTLILHRSGDLDSRVEEGRYIAEHIPGARFVELPGNDHIPWIGDADAMLDEVEEFLTGVRHGPNPDRLLITLLFTDIVGSTEQVSAMGDARWQRLVDEHHAVVRRELQRFRGHEVDTAGDGFLATFDGPARAIRCARAIGAGVRRLGIHIRAGIHTGECEVSDNRVRGIAVHIGARVMGQANRGEILVSGTVRDLVAGSGILFEDRGTQPLKGVPGTWRLFAVAAD